MSDTDRSANNLVRVTLAAEDVETALFCVLSGRARLRELGDTVNDEGPVDNLAVAAHVLWDALPEDMRFQWPRDSISQETRDELAHVLNTRLNEDLDMEEGDDPWSE